MAILVAGGAGYIGSHMVKDLIEHGYDVVVADNLSTGHKKAINPKAKFYYGDIRDRAFLDRIFVNEDIEAVVHFAAFSIVPESMSEPLKYFDNNTSGMVTLLEAMRDFGVKYIVFSSTAATYGTPEHMPIKETDPQKPINPYGLSKLMMEQMMAWADKAYGIKFVALRYFNVAGCGPVELEDPAILNLIPMLFNRLKQGKAPAIFGDDYPTPDGTCVRDYIHVSDLADAHIAALKYLDRDERKYDAFNVGTGEGTSVRQIVDEVKKVTGLPFTEAVMARRAGDPPHLIGSPKRINEEMGWHAKYDVEDIVKSAWDAWQANPEHHIDVDTWKQAD